MSKIYVVMQHDMSFDWDHPRDTVICSSFDKELCEKTVAKLYNIAKPDYIDSRSYHIDTIPFLMTSYDMSHVLRGSRNEQIP